MRNELEFGKPSSPEHGDDAKSGPELQTAQPLGLIDARMFFSSLVDYKGVWCFAGGACTNVRDVMFCPFWDARLQPFVSSLLGMLGSCLYCVKRRTGTNTM